MADEKRAKNEEKIRKKAEKDVEKAEKEAEKQSKFTERQKEINAYREKMAKKGRELKKNKFECTATKIKPSCMELFETLEKLLEHEKSEHTRDVLLSLCQICVMLRFAKVQGESKQTDIFETAISLLWVN